MGTWIYKILGGVITLVVSLSFLPVLQDGIDELVGTEALPGTYYGTTTGSLLQLLPTILVIVFVFVAVALIPKNERD